MLRYILGGLAAAAIACPAAAERWVTIGSNPNTIGIDLDSYMRDGDYRIFHAVTVEVPLDGVVYWESQLIFNCALGNFRHTYFQRYRVDLSPVGARSAGSGWVPARGTPAYQAALSAACSATGLERNTMATSMLVYAQAVYQNVPPSEGGIGASDARTQIAASGRRAAQPQAAAEPARRGLGFGPAWRSGGELAIFGEPSPSDPTRPLHWDDRNPDEQAAHVRACRARYRSYDLERDSFRNNDGQWIRCSL